MKNHILPLLLCFALATTACEFRDDFQATNVNDLVTVSANKILVNDYGQAYTIVQDETDHLWSSGDRLLIRFDVLNRNYDITLKQYQTCLVKEITPQDEEQGEGEDPVSIAGSALSGGFVNLQISYYAQKGSNYAHNIYMEYKDNPDNNSLELFLLHDGNNENPSTMADDELEVYTKVYCFLLRGLLPEGTRRSINITMYELNALNDVVKNTYPLYEQEVIF